METLNPILSRLSYEMNCCGLVEDIAHINSTREYNDLFHILAMLCLDYEDEEMDDEIIEMIIVSKICESDEEEKIIRKAMDTVNLLLATPNSILRPYQQHFVTEKYDN